jgi:hypothetical protein
MKSSGNLIKMPGGNCPGSGEHVGDWHVERPSHPTRIVLTSLQRDFLDRYSVECVYCCSNSNYARELSKQHGFTYEHMRRLWDAYCRSWGNDLDPSDGIPPLSPPPEPPIFPWSSIGELDEQLEAEAGTMAAAEAAARSASTTTIAN